MDHVGKVDLTDELVRDYKEQVDEVRVVAWPARYLSNVPQDLLGLDGFISTRPGLAVRPVRQNVCTGLYPC